MRGDLDTEVLSLKSRNILNLRNFILLGARFKDLNNIQVFYFKKHLFIINKFHLHKQQ